MNNLSVHKINQQEFSQLLLEDALKEGWYYSQQDIQFYFNYKYNHLYAVKVNNEFAGGVIFNQSPSHFQNKNLCSAGAFLVKERFRGQKIVGPYLMQQVILNNLSKDSIVCFHSVPRVVDFYGKLGFKQTALVDKFYTLMLENINPEYELTPKGLSGHTIKRLEKNNLAEINPYNNSLFKGDIGLGFHAFITDWLKRSDIIAFIYQIDGVIQGYGAATICRTMSTDKFCYRFSPLYADQPRVACALLKTLVHAVKSNGHRIELSSLWSFDTEFGVALQEIGFIESGKNIIVCNQPELINKHSSLLNKVFCSLPLEYPPEVIATVQND